MRCRSRPTLNRREPVWGAVWWEMPAGIWRALIESFVSAGFGPLRLFLHTVRRILVSEPKAMRCIAMGATFRISPGSFLHGISLDSIPATNLFISKPNTCGPHGFTKAVVCLNIIPG